MKASSTAFQRLQTLRSRLPSPLAVYVVAVVFFLLVALRLPGIATRIGILSLLTLAAILGIASVGQTLAVIIGGIDLSIPAVMGLGDVLLAYLDRQGWAFGAIVGLILILAIAIGVTNGLVSSLFHLHPLVVTIGTGSIVGGGVLLATGGHPGGTVPGFITAAVSPIGTTWIIPLPAVVVSWLVITVLIVAIQYRTTLGRRLYALGANLTAANLALIRPPVIRAAVYSISAVCAATAGVLLGGFSGGASAQIGDPYLFATVTAVVVGGTSLMGGRGGYERTVAGVIITIEITTLLIGLGFGASMQEALLGIVILVLIVAYGREARLADQV